ncbi:MAG: nucleoside triphosphate pyrophosphohydrolase [Minwuiales bacterium]|nr:nucleoside triphosphate pyrophosphohydrolase [Minwuiales bacterium]
MDDLPSSSPITRLLRIMARLRDPDGGCPWDVEQTFASIAPYTIEEAYEVADAIEQDDMAALKDELGDLLLQVVFHAQMADEAGHFAFDDVAAAIGDKMVRRHPHVFADQTGIDSADRQTLNWESQKAAERAAKASQNGETLSVLDGVTAALPALTRAIKLQNRAARVGFDWPDVRPVLDKLDEELGELRHELDNGAAPERVADEFGDVLFVLANLARHLKVDPESSLRSTNAKFERRFRRIEQWLTEAGTRPEDATLEDLDRLWDKAKAEERTATKN